MIIKANDTNSKKKLSCDDCKSVVYKDQPGRTFKARLQ